TIKVAKIPKPLLPIIATVRGWQRVKMWNDNQFISQLEPLTDQTVEALQTKLADTSWGSDLVVTRSYEFRRPALLDVLPPLLKQGYERFVIVPMYMGTGDFTHGMTEIAMREALEGVPGLRAEQLEMCGLTDTSY